MKTAEKRTISETQQTRANLKRGRKRASEAADTDAGNHLAALALTLNEWASKEDELAYHEDNFRA